MIPKIIHYCWFGRGNKSKLIEKCIKSWREMCPDYEIREWNETNFNVNQFKYTKEAYDSKKWAFVSDFVRLYALYNYGGIYLDTDVELVKSPDKLLTSHFVSGWENKESLQSAFMASERKNKIIKLLLETYYQKSFIVNEGVFDMIPNTQLITNQLCKEYGLVRNGKFQVNNEYSVYDRYVFSPKKPGYKSYKVKERTIAVHHFEGTWLPHSFVYNFKLCISPILNIMRKIIVKLIGERQFKKIRRKI